MGFGLGRCRGVGRRCPFEAALGAARRGARYVVVGALGQQAAGGSRGEATVDTLALMSRGISVTGLSATDHRAMAARLAGDGRLFAPDGRALLAHRTAGT
ncbi:MAG TPA: hypothetical protein VFP69_10725 [Streptomyces sp.]|nr:hypothetical protein [Streptomyces sp.]